MKTFFISPCVIRNDDVIRCSIDTAEFFTVYRQNEDGTADAIGDYKTIPDAAIIGNIHSKIEGVEFEGVQDAHPDAPSKVPPVEEWPHDQFDPKHWGFCLTNYSDGTPYIARFDEAKAFVTDRDALRFAVFSADIYPNSIRKVIDFCAEYGCTNTRQTIAEFRA